MLSAPASIPGDDRGELVRRVRPGVTGQPDPVGDRVVQSGLLGQAHHRNEAGTRHQIRIVERCARDRRVMA